MLVGGMGEDELLGGDIKLAAGRARRIQPTVCR